MQKVDVALQSNKKPESLIYTLFSLKKHCGDNIDTVYINDDCSGDDVVACYTNEALHKALAPMKIKIRVNEKRGGAGKTLFTKGFHIRDLNQLRKWVRAVWNKEILIENDMRYQWAINSTDKEFLFIIHDDIKFHGNVVKLYSDILQENAKNAIVGDLGQCWNCGYENCNPELIMSGHKPHDMYPLTPRKGKLTSKYYDRDCRINEWCCMINVNVARELSIKHTCYFGNSEDRGDTAAYWFCKINELGYQFRDPLPNADMRIKYYQHWWQGHTGHSVWVDQGKGIAQYQADMIRECIEKEFGYTIEKIK